MGIRFLKQGKGELAPPSDGHDPKVLSLVCLFSMTVHIAVFAGAVWLHDFDFLPPKPRVVRVDLISFAPGPETGETLSQTVETQTPEPTQKSVKLNTAPAPEPVPEPAPEPAPIQVKKPDISLKSKPKNIKDLMAARKQKEKKPEKKKPKIKKPSKKDLEKARQELAQKVAAENQAQIDQALKRMQKAVQGKGNGPKKGAGLGVGTGKISPDILELYKMQIAMAIRHNWVFSETMAGLDQNLEVKVFVKILKSGDIRDIAYETRSGNRYLDESAKKAIRRSNPLPELPKGMASFEVVLGFTPKGLK